MVCFKGKVAPAAVFVSSPTVVTAPPAPSGPVAPHPEIVRSVTPEQAQAMTAPEKNRLSDWAAKNDPASLSNILGDLVNPQKEIRVAAIAAVKQFRDPSAIPVLKGIAANSDDPSEQQALLDAAEFLSLPVFDLAAKPDAAQPGAAADGGTLQVVVLSDPRQGIKQRRLQNPTATSPQ